MSDDLVYLDEVKSILKSAVHGCNSCLQKVDWAMGAAYDEPIVEEYLEDPQAPGHRFPGPEQPHKGEWKDVAFEYHKGVPSKAGQKAPQVPPDSVSVQIDPVPYIKKAMRVQELFGMNKADPKKDKVTGEMVHPVGHLKKAAALLTIVKAYQSELAKAPPMMQEPADMPPMPGQEDRLCPRCGGGPCKCPGDGEQKPMPGAAAAPMGASPPAPGAQMQLSNASITKEDKVTPDDLFHQRGEDQRRPLKSLGKATDILQKASCGGCGLEPCACSTAAEMHHGA